MSLIGRSAREFRVGSGGTVQNEFQGRRRALLIGVTATPALADDPELHAMYGELTCAERDVEAVAEALEKSEYEVTRHHAGRVREIDLVKSGIQRALRQFFTSCEPGDTAFVYLSGHGVTIGDDDFLLAADAQPGEPLSDGSPALMQSSLLPANPVGLQLGFRPQGVTTVICLDACRETEPPQRGDEDQTGAWVGAQDAAWLYSCGDGQRSYADQEHGSWFGRALAHALAPETPPTTFGEIMRYTEHEMRRLAGDEPVEPPTVRHLAPFRQPVDTLELCKGYKEPLPWAEMVTKSALWEHTSGSEAVQARVKAGLAELAEQVGRNVRSAGAHQDDPWSDARSTYPARFERQLVGLVKRAQHSAPQALLSPAETAVLLAAPLVYEDITAVALEDLRQVLDRERPADVEPEPHAELVFAAVEDVRRAHKQVQGTLETLRGRGLVTEAKAAEHWLRHRFIADWDALWERTGDYPSVDVLLCRLARVIADSAEEVPLGGPSEQSLQRIDGQLRQVLGHVTVEPGDRPRVNDFENDTWNTFAPVLGGRWRAQELAQLLWTAGLLSADPRRMSSVLIDHLGAHEPLAAHTVVGALSEEFELAAVGELSAGGYRLDVRFPCPHPALHAAVEELAARADASVSAIRERWLAQRSSMPSLLRGLPERVTARQLVPEPGQYTAPLERFRLAEDEIRPLLMGAQLYGDRMLAVRELYQNALDACRLRDMRDQYGRRQGEAAEKWTGRITFTQGWDEEGRLYIECEDNGTGMSRAKLTSMFARAGKRYEQDPEFMQERREWRRAGLTPVALNSRFGIGAFSYFMLAEEVVVTTAPVDRHGLRESLDQASRAEIQSGSGLLRITPGKGAPSDGGTRVRLYLALGEDEQPPSLVETLQSVLWVSDYTVRAVEYARDDPEREVRGRTWAPGRLQAVARWRGPAAHAEGSDVWLVQGPGQLLLDGVVISDAPSVFGYVVNLRERHRPVPSVDRNNLLSYDEDMVLEELRATVSEAAAQWSEVSLRWLWELARTRPPLAVALLDALPKDVTAILEPLESDVRLLRERLPLRSTGCLPIDATIVSRGNTASRQNLDRSLFRRWRMTRLEHAPVLKQGFSPAGYPEPASLDALIFHETSSPRGGWASALTAAAWAGVPLRDTVKALRRYAIAGVHVPAVPDIRSRLSVRISPAAADLYAAYTARPTRGRATHAPMVVISSEHQLSLGECVTLLCRLRALDVDLPPAPELDEALARERFTRAEAQVLAADTTTGPLSTPRWYPGETSITHLRKRVSLIGAGASAAGELLGRLRHMAPLGFTVLGAPGTPLTEHDALTSAERLLLRVDPSHGNPWQEGVVSLRQLVAASEGVTVSLGEAARILNEASRYTGIRAPDVPVEALGWTPPSWVARAMRYWRKQTQVFGPWELVNSFLDGRTLDSRGTDEFRETVKVLAACGLLASDPSWDQEALIRQAAAPQVGSASTAFSESLLDARPVPVSYCLELAGLGETLGTVLDWLEAESENLPLDLPQLSSEARSVRVTALDSYLLPAKDSEPEASDTRASSTIRRLLRHADRLGTPLSSSIGRLTTLTAIGVPPLPGEVTGPDADALADFRPDRFDLVAFNSDLLGPGTLGPLELVLLAGRFGRTLKATYDRYVPFRCLGLDVTVREPTPQEAEIIPHWADVIVLTEQLTGRAPAVSGTVTPDHVTLCSEETDLTEAEVRERLGRYAALFGLRVPNQEQESERVS
ncbi:caspase family protein [Streptomyces sp. DSM 3412]|uniref:Caspase family protein n=1 Tax=Streptomyces gottesmaniae TaxID=3075518 RepID=A0ABU2YZA7_9ACTN|nr:caspase family protein [Streptomyces sp. DSM 3412]MDT0569652.1 caspase family protein [Streptomyces sp. DSM 3412]